MVRIATVAYLNAEPLIAGLDPEKYSINADIPARVAEDLSAGRADVALTPVVAALDDGDFRIVGGVAIGSNGPVHSVVLVGETSPEEWEEIVLDGESRTSAVLTQVLLNGPLASSCSAKVVEGEPGVGVERARGRTAALVIGDAAMNLPERLKVRLDLGEIWTDWTGLPFVFAVWAGRPDLPGSVRRDLRESAAVGLHEISRRYQGAERDYLLHNISYNLDDRALMGLRRFAALAHDAGLLCRRDVRLYGPTETSRPRLKGLEQVLSRASEGERISADALKQCAQSAHLSDLASAATLRSPPPEWPAPSIFQRLALDSSPSEVAASLVQGRSNGAETLRLEGLGALTQPDAAIRLRSLPAEGKWALSLHGRDVLVNLSAAWSITVTEVLDWLSKHEITLITGLDERHDLSWLQDRPTFTVGLSLPVTPSEQLESVLRSIDTLCGLAEGLEHQVYIELEPTAAPGETSAVEGFTALCLARLGLPEKHRLVLSSERWGVAVAVAALRMGASDLGGLTINSTAELPDGEMVSEHLTRLKREIAASGLQGVEAYRSAHRHNRAPRT